MKTPLALFPLVALVVCACTTSHPVVTSAPLGKDSVYPFQAPQGIKVLPFDKAVVGPVTMFPQLGVIELAGTIDGSERLMFTQRRVTWEHRFWSPAKNVRFNGRAWTNLSRSPQGWTRLAKGLDLSRASIVARSGRDVIALERRMQGFALYLADSPSGAADYTVTILIPGR